MDGVSSEQIIAALGDLVSDVPRRALTGALGEHLAREVDHALSPRDLGW
jgi:hypothetical protein